MVACGSTVGCFQDGLFHTRWMELWSGSIETRWLYLFMVWDTSWYVGLAHFFSFERTFFPGYPILIRLFGSMTGNYWFAAFALSVLFGFAFMPLFQATAEAYVSRNEAIGSTLIMFSFPYVFLYTTVAYSESLFLFSALTTWYLYLKNRLRLATLWLILTTFTKAYGILLVLPIVIDLLAHRRWRKIPLALTPAFLAGIFVTLFNRQNLLERLILEMNTATWAVSRVGTGYFWARDYIFPLFASDHPTVHFDYWHGIALAFIVLIGCLAIYAAKIDWRLGIYSALMFIIIVFFWIY